MAWDVLSLSLLWKVELRTTLLVADPRTDHVAAFSPDNSVYIFKASSAKWIFEKKKLCGDEHEILGALFFPVADTSDIKISVGDASWVSRSSLYFFTSAQVSVSGRVLRLWKRGLCEWELHCIGIVGVRIPKLGLVQRRSVAVHIGANDSDAVPRVDGVSNGVSGWENGSKIASAARHVVVANCGTSMCRVCEMVEVGSGLWKREICVSVCELTGACDATCAPSVRTVTSIFTY